MKMPRKRDGDRLEPRDYNVLAAEVERLGKLVVVGAQSFTPDAPSGPRVVLASSPNVRLAKSSSSIAAISGNNMAQGTCFWYGGTGTLLTPNIGTVYPYNALGVVVPTATKCTLAYDEGGSRWLVIDVPGSDQANTVLGRCDCPEATYEIEVDDGCGSCFDRMPKYWWLTISTATPRIGAPVCEATTCGPAVAGARIKMVNVSSGGSPTCEWLGEGGACLFAQLEHLSDGRWRLRIYDRNDCVLAELYLDDSAFDCCGTNTGWALDPVSPNGACNLDVSIEPDPCTCCPEYPLPCPPDGEPICAGSECCWSCNMQVDVWNLVTNSGPPDPTGPERCESMDGFFVLGWSGDCRWEWRAVHDGDFDTDAADRVVLTWAGGFWTLTITGVLGQVAVFRNEMGIVGCANVNTPLAYVPAESTCYDAGSYAELRLDL
jgi:hypothetical protein